MKSTIWLVACVYLFILLSGFHDPQHNGLTVSVSGEPEAVNDSAIEFNGQFYINPRTCGMNTTTSSEVFFLDSKKSEIGSANLGTVEGSENFSVVLPSRPSYVYPQIDGYDWSGDCSITLVGLETVDNTYKEMYVDETLNDSTLS